MGDWAQRRLDQYAFAFGRLDAILRSPDRAASEKVADAVEVLDELDAARDETTHEGDTP